MDINPSPFRSGSCPGANGPSPAPWIPAFPGRTPSALHCPADDLRVRGGGAGGGRFRKTWLLSLQVATPVKRMNTWRVCSHPGDRLVPRGHEARLCGFRGPGAVSPVLLPLLPWAGGCSGRAAGPALGKGSGCAPLRSEAAPAENAWAPKIRPGSGPGDSAPLWAGGPPALPAIGCGRRSVGADGQGQAPC